ncbi:hypothetical protein RQV73_003457 [Vibrio fluvialis]|nr:hypothetical protein [Vibrio fluvialis]
MNKFIIFVHGLGGKVDGTWGKFPQFIIDDGSIEHKVIEYGYTSPNLFKQFYLPAPTILSIANGLLTDIQARCDLQNDDIILVGHSMGGLVIRKMLLRLNAKGINHNIRKICFFDVPHEGSGFANIGKHIAIMNRHLKALVSNSSELDDLNEQWADKKLDEHLNILSIVDANETVVSAMSSKSIFRNHPIETINEVDHSSIVKPNSENDTVVLLLKDFIKSTPSVGKLNLGVGKPINNWLKYDERKHELPYKADNAREEAFNALTQALESATPYIRLTGLSGLGKSRLVLEYKNVKNIDDNDFFVINGADVATTVKRAIQRATENGAIGHLIIDNCAVDLHNYAVNAIVANNSPLKLITTYFYHDEEKYVENSIKIKLERLASQQISDIIDVRLPDLDRNSKQQLELFIEGFPLLAQMATHELQQDGQITTNFSEPELVEKLINGDGTLTDDSRELLKVFSLFDYFQYQKGTHQSINQDAEFINSIARTEQISFEKTIQAFNQKELINCTNNLARIVPKPLALNLAMEWWNTSVFDRQADLVSNLPQSLQESFCKQIKYLDSSIKVQSFVENFCHSNRPFGQAELLLTKAGSRLFRALVEVNPDATTKLIYRIIDGLNDEEISAISGDVRRNFVWSLEMLVFHNSCFEKAAWCLFKLAQFENESYGNNATGQFSQLFSTQLCGTEANFEKRLALLDKIIGLNIKSADLVIIQAVKSAISTHGGSRTIGAEYQGTKPELKEWQPKTYSEIYIYWQCHLDILITLVKRNYLTEQVKDVFGHEIRGLIRFKIHDRLDHFIKEVIRLSGKYWPAAAQSITHALNYDAKGLEPKQLELLKSWEKLLSPDENNLEEKLKLIVLNPSREHVKGDDGHYIDVAAEDAKHLAESIKEIYIDLIPHFEMLMTFPEQKQSWIFAKHLVLQVSDTATDILLEHLLDYLRRNKPKNTQFMSGFFAGLSDKNMARWNEALELVVSDENLVNYYPDVVRTGKFCSHHLDVFIKLIIEGKLSSSSAAMLSYGSVTEHLTEKDIAHFCMSLSEIDATGTWVALDNINMYMHGRKDLDLKLIYPTLRNLVLNVSFTKEDKTRHSDSYHWLNSVEKLLDTEDVEFSLNLCIHLINQVGNHDIDYSDLWDYVGEAFYKAFELHGQYLWPRVSDQFIDGDNLKQYRLLDLLGSGKSYRKRDKSIFDTIDVNTVVEWCKDEVALLVTSRAITMFISDGDSRSFNPLLLKLISEYGDNRAFSSEVSANFSSRSWSGSLVPYLQEDKKLIVPLIDNENMKVRSWAKLFIDSIDSQMEWETKREAEEQMLRGSWS